MLLFKDPKYLFIEEVTWRGEWAEVLVDGFFSAFIQLKYIGVPKYSTNRCKHKSCGIAVQNTVKQKQSFIILQSVCLAYFGASVRNIFESTEVG